MFKQIRRIALFLVLISAPLYAVQDLVGIGVSLDESTSKSMALDDLSSSLFVEVFSQVTVCQEASQDEVVDCGSQQFLQTKSRLPLLGVQYEVKLAGTDVEVRATLNVTRALPFYEAELQRLRKSIGEKSSDLSKGPGQASKANLLNQLSVEIEDFERLRLVYSLLSGNQFQSADITKAEISAQLEQLKQEALSLDFMAKLIVQKLVAGRVKVDIYPPTLSQAKEMTPFARVVRDKIRQHAARYQPAAASSNHFLRGEYEILQDGDISLTYRLLDNEQQSLRSFNIRVDSAAFKGIRADALAPDFDRLLHEEVVVSRELRSEMVTDRGSRDLLYDAGETVKLMVRLNQAGYFYIVGHVVHEDETYSYLLELNDGRGDQKFISYIPPDYSNKFVELGEFEVEAPFGVEHLQLIASNKSLLGEIPEYQYDQAAGYYQIVGSKKDVESAVIKTRGLKSKSANSKGKRTFTESVLTFTTMQ